MAKTILAIGGHIGDAELTAGGVLASNAVDGGKSFTLALTAGERGNPTHITVEDYRKQKISEAEAFAELMNGKAYVLPYADGELPDNDEVRYAVANVIREVRPDVIITHWKSTMHKDHGRTHKIVCDAQFLASVVECDKIKGERKYAPVYFAENWEDDPDFTPYIYVDITRGFDLWCEGMKKHRFIMNSRDFAYFDYYTSLARVRGCLNKTKYAEAFGVFDRQKKIKKDML
ncbi:MAG: PIG-L family deacetylase [Clostridia bacterium]|nr:PIG-L family deacetylase [Clostridia bacterium]